MMTTAEQKNLACELNALCVFRGILESPPMMALIALLSSDENEEKQMKLFGEFVYSTFCAARYFPMRINI